MTSAWQVGSPGPPVGSAAAGAATRATLIAPAASATSSFLIVFPPRLEQVRLTTPIGAASSPGDLQNRVERLRARDGNRTVNAVRHRAGAEKCAEHLRHHCHHTRRERRQHHQNYDWLLDAAGAVWQTTSIPTRTPWRRV